MNPWMLLWASCFLFLCTSFTVASTWWWFIYDDDDDDGGDGGGGGGIADISHNRHNRRLRTFSKPMYFLA